MRIALAVAVSLSGFTAMGQTQGKYHEIKSFLSNNLPIENQNWNIYQHPVSGSIFFANSEGLIEFDGLAKTTCKLPYNKGARSVCIDEQGTVFTGSFEEFGFWDKSSDCKWVYHSLSKTIPIDKNEEIWKIYIRSNKVYFQSFTTIYVYDYHSLKPYKAPFTLLFMFPYGNEFMVQVLGTGLFTFNNGKYTFIKGSELFAQIKIHAFVPAGNGNYFIGTSNNGLYKFDGLHFVPFKSEVSEFLKYNTCNNGVAISDSLFVFGTILNGIVECDASGKIKSTTNFSNGLNNNTVLSLYKDKEHGLWVGLDQGANYLEMLSPVVQYTNVTGTLGTIYTLLKSKNTLYIGTNQGLFMADITRSEMQYSFSDVRMVPGSQGQVWTLREFDGNILCGHNEGTYLVKNESLLPVSNVTGGWTIKPLNDKLIEGTYTGLIIFSKDAGGTWKFRNRIIGFNEPTRHLEIDYLGYVWASHHQRGIYKLELNDNADSVRSTSFFNKLEGISGNIDVFKINNRVVFTTGTRLYTFNYDANRMEPFESLNNQVAEFKQASQIIPYQKNLYWFVFGNKVGLFEISLDFKVKKVFELYQRNVRSPENDLEIIQIDDRNIIFPNHKGFVVYNASLRQSETSSFPLAFTHLVFQGKGKTLEVCSDGDSKAIPFDLNNLTVYFADPSRFNVDEKTYLYRIPEIEEQWHSTFINNFNYHNLKYGAYTLQLKTNISNNTVNFRFHIRPPWYLTRLAYVCYFILIVLLIYAGYSIFNYELGKQKKLLEMELKRNSLENELDITSNELMLTMRYLIQKNEILTELKQEIDELKEQSSKYPVKPIKNIERIIKEGLDTQTESWKTAMTNLKLSQQGFYKRLKEKHPDLTTNDLRLCLYLRMNFTTKEIAHLLNISTRGVEIGRYRLRKKMNLAHDINLSEYLMQEDFGTMNDRQSV